MVFFSFVQKWQNSINFILPLKIIFIYLASMSEIQIMNFNFEKKTLLIYLAYFFVFNLFTSLMFMVLSKYYTIDLSVRAVNKNYRHLSNYNNIKKRFIRFSKLHLNYFSSIIFVISILLLYLIINYKIFIISILFSILHILVIYVPIKFFSNKGLKKYLRTEGYKEVTVTFFWLGFVAAAILLLPDIFESNKYLALIVFLVSRFLFATIVSSIRDQSAIFAESKLI